MRCIKQSVTLEGLDGGSFMLMSLPVLNQSNAVMATSTGNVISSLSPGVSTDQVLCPLVINRYAAGQDFMMNNYDAQYALTIPVTYLRGKSRLIGMGFEIHDVSPELYKQGTITAFQVNQAVFEPNVMQFAGSLNGTTSLA